MKIALICVDEEINISTLQVLFYNCKYSFATAYFMYKCTIKSAIERKYCRINHCILDTDQ